MIRTNTIRAVFIIILWSSAVHYPGLFSPFLDEGAVRQCQTAMVARNYARHGMLFLNPELDGYGPPERIGAEFPAYSYLLAVAFEFIGFRDVLGRALSSVFAAWGAVFLYLFVKRRMGERIALWSALAMCALPVHVYFTRTCTPDAMALWALLGFLYYGDQWLTANRNGWTWLCIIFLGVLAPLLKLEFLGILVPLWLFLGIERFGAGFWKNVAWTAAFALILIGTAAWYQHARTAPIQILTFSLHDLKANLAPITAVSLWKTQFISRLPVLVTTPIGLFFAVIGFYYFRNAKAFFSFCAWLVVGTLYVLMLGNYGLSRSDALLPLAPIAGVWMACGITSFWEHAKNHLMTTLLAVVLTLGIGAQTAMRIRPWYALSYSYLPAAKAALAAAATPSDPVLLSSRHSIVILYSLDHAANFLDPSAWSPGAVGHYLHRGVRFILVPKEENRVTLPKWSAFLRQRARILHEDSGFLLYQIR